jgi:hypothetical protein
LARRVVCQAEAGQQLACPGLRFGATQVPKSAHHQQVFLAGEQLIDRGVLAGQPDQPAHPFRCAKHVDATHGDRSGVRLQQRGEDPHHGGLASAVRS